MIYEPYNYRIQGVYKATYNWGPHIVVTRHHHRLLYAHPHPHTCLIMYRWGTVSLAFMGLNLNGDKVGVYIYILVGGFNHLEKY